MRGPVMKAAAGAFTGVALLLAAACGGGGGEPSPAATPSQQPEATQTPVPAPQATVSGTFSLDGAGTPIPPGRGEPSGRIAFQSFRDGQQEVYLVNADGSGLQNITADEATDFDPDWSPDGTKIVFNSTKDGPGVYTMKADGSDRRRLTTSGVSPKWSPDGERIAYSRGGSIVIIDTDGGNPVAVYQGGQATPDATCTASAVLGDWSPDGEWIAFYTADLSLGRSEICAVAADGSDIKLIVKDPPGIHAEPNWSPDGTRIAYRSIRDGVHNIYVYDLLAGEETNLTDSPSLDAEPAWSPDGGWIVFVSDRDELESDIYTMSADGSDVRRLTSHPRKDSFPTWAP